jgi:hypothetical protein
MDLNRILSGLLAVMYVVAAFVGNGAETCFKVVMFLILPLACIWFGDAMGEYIGQSGSGYITETSPGFLVRILGWLLLLLPMILALYFSLVGSKP